MSWLDNLEQFIWDLAWDSWLSGGRIELSESNYSGNKGEDIVIKLCYF